MIKDDKTGTEYYNKRSNKKCESLEIYNKVMETKIQQKVWEFKVEELS